MPENQNVNGDHWNNNLNKFLSTIMGWKQLGVSNIDISDPVTGKPRGIDSVFSYKRNPYSNQEIIIVEAKSIEKMDYLEKNKIEQWVGVLLEKMESLPYSEDFRSIYNPELDARCQYGVIGLWVRDVDTYSEDRLQSLLSQIQIVNRRKSYYIAFISNSIFNVLNSIDRELKTLVANGEINKWKIHYPSFGDFPKVENANLTFETFFSKFLFYEVEKNEHSKSFGRTNTYQSNMLFYIGEIKKAEDFLLIGEAIKRFDLFRLPDLDIYVMGNTHHLRSEIENFKRAFQSDYGSCQIDFRQLMVINQFPETGTF